MMGARFSGQPELALHEEREPSLQLELGSTDFTLVGK